MSVESNKDKIDELSQYRIAKVCCLHCRRPITGAMSSAIDRPASPGDLTVCIYCSHFMMFTDDMGLRELTEAEVHDVVDDSETLLVLKALMKLRKQMREAGVL